VTARQSIYPPLGQVRITQPAHDFPRQRRDTNSMDAQVVLMLAIFLVAAFAVR
jgi:hypothetical protein